MAKKAAVPEDDDEKKKLDDKIKKADLERIRGILGLGMKDDSVMPADQYEAVSDIISTGHAELDRILTPTYYESGGKGGIPRGFVCEFFGPYAGGKSSLCLMLAAHATQAGDKVFWVDAEGSYVPDWAASHGVVNSRVLRIGPPKTGEQFLEVVENAARSKEFALVVVDSVTGLVPGDVMNKPLDENAKIGAAASMMSRVMPRLVAAAKKGNCAVVFINQIRMKIGVMYGNPETTPGGEALRFFASLRVRLSQIGSKKDRGIVKDGEDIGIRSKVQVVKSRFGPPYKEAILPIYYNAHVKPHPLDQLLDLALATKIIKCKTKKEEGQDIEAFTLEDSEIRNVTSFEAFKAELQTEHIKTIAVKLGEKKPLDAEILAYIKSLDDDPTA